MDTSLFLAKFWGWYLIIFFVILSFNPKRIKQIFDYSRDEKFLVIASCIAIIVGLLNVLFHNIWELNYKLIITLIGWSALLKGLSLFMFPKRTIKGLEFINIKFVQALYTLLLLLGLYLLNIGYAILPI